MDFWMPRFEQVPFCKICKAPGHHTGDCPYLPEFRAQVLSRQRYNPPQPIYDPYSNVYNSGWYDYQDNGYEQPNYGYEGFQATHQSRESGESLEQLIDELVANTNKLQENIMPDNKPPQDESSKNFENFIAQLKQFQDSTQASFRNMELHIGQITTSLGKLETQGRLPSQTENFSIPEDSDLIMEDEEDLDFTEEDFLDFDAMIEKESYLNTEDFNLESEAEIKISMAPENQEKEQEERCLVKDFNLESEADIEIGSVLEEKNKEKGQEKGVMAKIEIEIPVIISQGKEQQTEPEIENIAVPENNYSFFIPLPFTEKFAKNKKDRKDKKILNIFCIKSISMKNFQRSTKRNWFRNARIKEGRSPKKKEKDKPRFLEYPVYKEDPGGIKNPAWQPKLIHYDPRNPEGVT